MPLDAEDNRYLLAASIAEEHIAWARRERQSPYVILTLLNPEMVERCGNAVTWIDALLGVTEAWLDLRLPMLRGEYER